MAIFLSCMREEAVLDEKKKMRSNHGGCRSKGGTLHALPEAPDQLRLSSTYRFPVMDPLAYASVYVFCPFFFFFFFFCGSDNAGSLTC